MIMMKFLQSNAGPMAEEMSAAIHKASSELVSYLNNNIDSDNNDDTYNLLILCSNTINSIKR